MMTMGTTTLDQIHQSREAERLVRKAPLIEPLRPPRPRNLGSIETLPKFKAQTWILSTKYPNRSTLLRRGSVMHLRQRRKRPAASRTWHGRRGACLGRWKTTKMQKAPQRLERSVLSGYGSPYLTNNSSHVRPRSRHASGGEVVVLDEIQSPGRMCNGTEWIK